LGYSLGDSPVGLLAWIYEKLVNWTDDYPWTDDEGTRSLKFSFISHLTSTRAVLTWISIYWFSRAGPAASLRIYYEAAKAGDWDPATQNLSSNVAFGISRFPKDLVIRPKTWVRSLGHVVFEREHDSGGHFAAHEKPDELVDDLRAMFGRGGPAFGVVKAQTGYAKTPRANL
jgi:hypothetical protein